MKEVFTKCSKAIEESNSKLHDFEKDLCKPLEPRIKLKEALEIVETDESMTVTRFFNETPVIEFHQNSNLEYRNSIFLKGEIGIGKIIYDDKHYIGLINSKTFTPYLAGVYTIDNKDTLYLSNINYSSLNLKPAHKSQEEVFNFLKTAVEKEYLDVTILDFLENPASLSEATVQHVKNATLNFNNVALFNENQSILMFEGSDYNYDTKKYEPQHRFNIIQQDGTETNFKNLKATELNELVTTINQYYVQSKQVLHPLSMIIRNSKTLKSSQELEQPYYVSTSEIEDLRNAEYFQYSSDTGLQKVDVKISGYVSGHKYVEYFKNTQELAEVAEKVNKWIEPIMCICLNNKEIGFKVLGNKSGVSIKTEVKEIGYLFE